VWHCSEWFAQMKSSPRTSPIDISEEVIRACVERAKTTGKPQVLVDLRCPGLQLVVTGSVEPRWVHLCYNSERRLQKKLLGRYPRMSIEKARQRAWDSRIEVKTAQIPRVRSTSPTLKSLVLRYEKHNPTPRDWGRLKNRLLVAFQAYLLLPLASIDWRELQAHVDGYPAPRMMRDSLSVINRILAWAEQQGIIAGPAQTLSLRPRAGWRDRSLRPGS
jgi:hypothetical protein